MEEGIVFITSLRLTYVFILKSQNQTSCGYRIGMAITTDVFDTQIQTFSTKILESIHKDLGDFGKMLLNLFT